VKNNSTTMTERSHGGAKARAMRADMLCPCTDMTHRDFAAFLSANPGLSFEEVMMRTGAGRNCTACTLDLEFGFAEAGRGDVEARAGAVAPLVQTQRTGFKGALYRTIDGMAPLVSSRTETWSPVLHGRGISQRLWIANHRLLFEKAAAGPVPHTAEVTVRDGDGAVRHARKYDVPVDDVLDLDLSRHLAGRGDSAALAVGSIQLVQQWTRPGLRGTTRSQIEIATPDAVCAVHTQAPGPAAQHRFTALHRPDEERLFYTVVNPSPRALTGETTTRLAGREEQAVESFAVPGYGAAIREVRPPEAGPSVAAGSAIDLAWQIYGPHKLHILCASPALDRFSIDHL